MRDHRMHQRPPKKFKPEPFAYHEELELTIDSLTNLGAGVARIDIGGEKPWVVFVPFTLPGEKVRVRIYRNDKNHSQADLVEVLEASQHRVKPKCPLFGECGGCQYQHLSYEEQLKWKQRQVSELMQHMAKIDFEVNPCLFTEQRWNYRSKITPHFKAPRDGEIGPIGFLADGTRSRIVDVEKCYIAMDEINEALPGAKAEIRSKASSFKRGSTILMRASQGRVEKDFKATAIEKVGDLEFKFVAGEFFQNNPFILPTFTDYVAKQAAKDGIKYLVDAYCGSGLFALTLAKHFEQVAGVEVSEIACEWARKNAEANGIDNAGFLTASAEHIFAEIAFPADQATVLIDPPRKGSSPEFLQQLVEFGPARVVYISCNPATQVRDLKQLSDSGYLLEDVQPVDLFPHTRHLESIMTLVPAEKSSH